PDPERGRPSVWTRTRARARYLAVWRRCVWVPGLHPSTRDSHGGGGDGFGATCEVCTHTTADVRGGRLSHADDPTHSSRYRQQRSAHGDCARRRRADLDHPGVCRTDGCCHEDDVCSTKSPHHASTCAARRTTADDHACTWRVSG